jgi:Cof subfamily protein (haloacid dehalogenase superfamily)
LEHQSFKDRLLVCDMDGTLLDSSSRLSIENKTALDRFVASGGLFTVATGRMEKSVMQYLQDLPVNLPAIVYNGAAIYDFQTDKMLWQDNLEPGVIEPVKEAMERFPEIGVEFYHGGMTYYVRENKHTYEHMIREKFDPIITDVDNVPQPWNKVILTWDPHRLPEVESFLKKFRIPFSQVYSEPQFLELLNLNTSKGNALKVLKKMFGLNDACVIAMGDNLNDMELIREANVGIAMGNAHTALKVAADMCCSHHDLSAVSEVIGWIEKGIIAV